MTTSAVWLLEILGGPKSLYFGPNRCNTLGYLTDITDDPNRAVRFIREDDAIMTCDWLKVTNVNRDPDPPRDFKPVEHMWHGASDNGGEQHG